MVLRVYNTLTRRKEEFVPLHGRRVQMFVCGMTPQDHTHLGHAKTYITFDVVARFLRHKGYQVVYLQNVTDVEDRIIDKMQATGQDWKEIVARNLAEYREVMDRLHCSSVDIYAYATDYIPEILAQIQGLLDKGFAYVARDGSVYYDTTKFKEWGKLSGQKVEELRPGARVTVDPNKRDPADFALWKAQKPGEPAWDSPWGRGRPGWHIEDTAITIDHFGYQYDIHGGGVELAFPHHEAEIAQAEAFTGIKPFVRYWLHGGMLMVGGEEMHKSLGNYWTVLDAFQRWKPDVIRFFFLNAHYRSPADFNPDALDEAGRSYARLMETVRNVDAVRRRAPPSGKADAALTAAARKALDAFDAAMSDDLNTREALAAVFDYAREVNRGLEAGAGRPALDEAAAAFASFGEVLGLFAAAGASDDVTDGLMDLLIGLREDARKRKDFGTADRIRDALGALGVVLEDTKDGVRWKRR